MGASKASREMLEKGGARRRILVVCQARFNIDAAQFIGANLPFGGKR